MMRELMVPTSLYLSASSHLSFSLRDGLSSLFSALLWIPSSPPTWEIHLSHSTSSSSSIFLSPWSDSFLLLDSHSISSNKLENQKKSSLLHQTSKSLAGLSIYTDFLLKLPESWKMFWVFILTCSYLSGKKK